MEFEMLTGRASSPEQATRISLESEDGLKMWLDPGKLFSNLFSRRCLFSVISVVGTQSNGIPGISELANPKTLVTIFVQQ